MADVTKFLFTSNHSGCSLRMTKGRCITTQKMGPNASGTFQRCVFDFYWKHQYHWSFCMFGFISAR